MCSRGSRRQAAIAAVLCCALSMAGCLTARGGRVRVPQADTLYVVAFVDMTREGKVGVGLAEAVQIEVYRRNPARLSVVFDDKSVALDGTVVAVEDTAVEGGARVITVQIEAMLTNKRGEMVADLGRHTTASKYNVDQSMTETDRRRDVAIETAIGKLAVKVVDAVDAAGEKGSVK